jgi:DNA-binding beta-propeller fold protein YncE
MKKIFLVVLVVLALAVPLLAQESAGSLRLLQAIPLSVDGRLDHLYAEVKGLRLFVAALGNNSVEVIDLRAGKVNQSITGPQKPQRMWCVRSQKKRFVASGNDGICRVYNRGTVELIESIKLDLGPDVIGYNPRSKVLYVGYGGEDAHKEPGNLAISDVVKNKHLGDIQTRAHPGGILVDDSGRRIYITIPKTSEIPVIDAKSNKIIETWQAAEAQRTVSLALDAAHGRLPAEWWTYEAQD